MSDNFQVKKSEYKVPPQDSYFMDLLFVERIDPSFGDAYYRWHWKIADVDGQKEYKGCRATSQTSLTPTLGNRFGAFIKVLYGKPEEGFGGTLKDIITAKYRVKGFLLHKKSKKDDAVFCNVETIIEGSARKGEGCGVDGASGKLLPVVNEWLSANSLCPVVPQERESRLEKESVQPASEAKYDDIPF